MVNCSRRYFVFGSAAALASGCLPRATRPDAISGASSVAGLSLRDTVAVESRARLRLMERLKGENEVPAEAYVPPQSLARTFWGIRFRAPIMNAAGMFRYAQCYDLVARQGAGAYIGGTGTLHARPGNDKHGIHLPFVIYPESGSASNWFGLPNEGDEITAQRIPKIGRIDGCPIGWSVGGPSGLDDLVRSLMIYDAAGVLFLEINESCPNTLDHKIRESEFYSRLKYIKENFLDRRSRRIPVIVKFSNDTPVGQVHILMDILFSLGYDGVNFGNTSTNYAKMRQTIAPGERALFDYYSTSPEFGVGGGVSGRPLKLISLMVASEAARYLKAGPPPQEFHVSRTGGIDCWEDAQTSLAAGISYVQWFTGYFERLRIDGNNVYRKMFEGDKA
ncbi:hypothetical protein HY988_07220 [Candidatus Micrarchaeota archaeon]|nr:hypothetical protein [Candidatus Micrarchaeota archaeon]